jgi:cytochrome b561
MNTPQPPTQFAVQSRILHWLMAVMILAMLFIGVSMVASLGDYHRLLAIIGRWAS